MVDRDTGTMTVLGRGDPFALHRGSSDDLALLDLGTARRRVMAAPTIGAATGMSAQPMRSTGPSTTPTTSVMEPKLRWVSTVATL